MLNMEPKNLAQPQNQQVLIFKNIPKTKNWKAFEFTIDFKLEPNNYLKN
jgi:hypothetical protein